jgi:hypothetical protein
MRIIRTNYYVDGLIHKLISVDGSAAGKETSDGKAGGAGAPNNSGGADEPAI